MFDQTDVHSRIALPVDCKQRRKQYAAADRRQPQAQGAALEAAQIIELGEEIVAFGQHPQRAAMDDLPDRGQRAAVTDPIQ